MSHTNTNSVIKCAMQNYKKKRKTKRETQITNNHIIKQCVKCAMQPIIKRRVKCAMQKNNKTVCKKCNATNNKTVCKICHANKNSKMKCAIEIRTQQYNVPCKAIKKRGKQKEKHKSPTTTSLT